MAEGRRFGSETQRDEELGIKDISPLSTFMNQAKDGP